jgi:hypothetical protein
MSDVLKHKTQSGKTDVGDPANVQPSWWNEEHEFSGGTDGQALVRDSGESDGAAWATVGDWDQTITKGTDQTVTNNATLQNDTELVAALLTNSVYLVEFVIVYSGNDATGDYKMQFTGPWNMAQQAQGYHVNLNASLAAGITATNGGAGGVWPAGALSVGTDALHSKFVFHGRIFLTTNAAGNLQFQFSNLSAASGRESTTYAGSMLRVKKLS